jgi:tetratricopeptide (TPR) repeat protein
MADWIKEHITSAERTHATYLSLAENVAADFPEFRPGDCEAAWSFFASYRFLAEFLSKAGQFESAARMYRCAAEGGMRLLPGWRENGKMGPALTNLANIYAQLGQMLWRTRKAEEAIEAYRQSVGFLKSRALLTDPAARYGFYHEQARHLTALGQVFAENNRAEEAQWSYEQALALWAGLKEDEPSRMQRLLSPSQAQEGMGDLFQERGNTAAAEQAYSQVMALRERSLQVRQATAGQEKIARQELARFLASCPLDKFRDPRRAVELAQEALEKADDSDGMGAKVLGMALYRTGAWKDAVAATRKGAATRRYADGSDFFFLAMAHWQLRETEQARDFYNRGVRWMEAHNPRDRELRRYRAEAETLLGVAGTTRNDKSPSARK